MNAIQLKEKLLHNSFNFEELALEVFHFQYKNNTIYREYIDLNKINIFAINTIQNIPFLPISFFKTHHVYIGQQKPEIIFKSSGTTGKNTSTHAVFDTTLYEHNAINCFTNFFGAIDDYIFLCLLPSYIEQGNSSLVYMCSIFIQLSGSNLSGFYLTDFNILHQQLQKAKQSQKKIILLGVTYALLDFAEQYPQDLSDCIVMETGGMKGKRKEMIKEEVHHFLQTQLNCSTIYAEYGMTELLSQAYSLGKGIYTCSNTLRVVCRDSYDPSAILQHQYRGGINIIDLANIYSCSFIATEDIGYTLNSKEFVLLGRQDASAIRGCNLLYEGLSV